MNGIHDNPSHWILDYLDGTLDPGTRLEVDAHLEVCESCRVLLIEYRETWGLLSHYPGPEPSKGFVPSVLEVVRHQNRATRIFRIRSAVIAAAAVILVAAWLVFGPFPFSGVSGVTEQDGSVAVEPELLENLDLIEDLDFLVEYGEDLELAMEVDLYEIISGEESL